MEAKARAWMLERVLIDATHTVKSGLRSGVQRVVRRVCHEGLKGAAGGGVSCLPVVCDSSVFVPVDMDMERGEFQDPKTELRADILGHLPAWYRGTAERVCRTIPHRRLRRQLLPAPGHLGVFRLPVKCIEWVRAGRREARLRAVDPRAGDLLVLPDAYWACPDVWPAVQRAKCRGAKVAVVIYDLLPITHAHIYGEKCRLNFERYLTDAVRHADVLAAISRTVREELLVALPQLFPRGDRCNRIVSFPLGAEFDDADGVVRAQVRSLFDTSRGITPYLMVASFDPRKNHPYALDAFEIFWKTCPDAMLCLVGAASGNARAFLTRAAGHPQLNRRLFLLHDLSDAEVRYCYERCRAVVFPSVAEGFGLPIVEALWKRRKVFVSDIPIHREVGEGDCEYFDLADPHGLADQLSRWERHVGPRMPPPQPARVCVPWEVSTRELFQRTRDALRERLLEAA